MAKVKQVWVSVGVTKNAGNYESGRGEEGILLELEPGDTESAVRAKARDYMREAAQVSATDTVDKLKAARR